MSIEVTLEISDRIAEARSAAGLTQAELAKELDINPQQISRYESGRAKPRDGVLKKMAAATGTSFEWLKLGKTQPNAPDLSHSQDPFNFIPPNLKGRILDSSIATGRSFESELIFRLEKSFEADVYQTFWKKRMDRYKAMAEREQEQEKNK
jgi:transcriptional regulator with XRE-family HTH domain